jgi:hypothetical protein
MKKLLLFAFSSVLFIFGINADGGKPELVSFVFTGDRDVFRSRVSSKQVNGICNSKDSKDSKGSKDSESLKKEDCDYMKGVFATQQKVIREGLDKIAGKCMELHVDTNDEASGAYYKDEFIGTFCKKPEVKSKLTKPGEVKSKLTKPGIVIGGVAVALLGMIYGLNKALKSRQQPEVELSQVVNKADLTRLSHTS